MEELKNKIFSANSLSKKIQYLTVVPDSWSILEIKNFFNVSFYAAKISKKLKKEKGIFSKTDQKMGKRLPDEVLNRVKLFYCDDLGLNSRIMPGKKDKVRISKNQYEQKRLLLCTLRELYSLYKKEYLDGGIGFSKFCQFRPKNCVLPGQSGTHAVCVCQTHQNFKFQIRATGSAISYKEVISKVVCDKENKNCMFGLCEKCQNESEVRSILQKLLFSYSNYINVDEFDRCSNADDPDYFDFEHDEATDFDSILEEMYEKEY